MSFLVPILSDSFDTLSQLGGDFRREARNERGVGLIDPLTHQPKNSFDQQSASLTESGVQDFNEFRLGQNFSRPNRYIEKAYDFIGDFEKMHGSGLERDFNDSDALNNDVIDNTKLANMKREPQRGPDEIFDEYGRKTEDFVGVIQSGIKQLEAERNLYLTATEQHARAMQQAQEQFKGGGGDFGRTFEQEQKKDIFEKAAKINAEEKLRKAKETVSKAANGANRNSSRKDNVEPSQPERSFAGPSPSGPSASPFVSKSRAPVGKPSPSRKARKPKFNTSKTRP